VSVASKKTYERSLEMYAYDNSVALALLLALDLQFVIALL
jgi:hypothetical protein